MGKGNHYYLEAKRKPIPTCPICGNLAKEQETSYGIRSTCCGLWSWDRFPLVDAETHEARREAHRVFDKLWKFGGLSRSEAYKLLAKELAMEIVECHIKMMSKGMVKQVPDAVRRIRRQQFRKEVNHDSLQPQYPEDPE